jgi:hypothetical protein
MSYCSWRHSIDKEYGAAIVTMMKAKSTVPVPSWDLVGPSWRLLLKYYEPVIFLFILPSLLLVLGSLLLGDTQHLRHLSDISQRQHVGIGLMGLSVLWSIVNIGPALYFRLQAAAGKPVSLSACYRLGLRFSRRLIGLYLLIGLVLVIGFVLFIIPGLILGVIFINRYYLVEYYLVDRNLSIREALRASHKETADYHGSIWGIIGVQASFGLMAGIIGGISRIGAVPAIFIQLVTLFVPVLRYRELKRLNQPAGKK